MKNSLWIIFATLLFFACMPPVTRLPMPNPGYEPSDNVNRPPNPILVSKPQPWRVKLDADLTITMNMKMERLIATLPLPPNTPHQTVVGWDVTPKNYRLVTSKYGYRFLEFDLGKLGTHRITYTAEVDLSKIRYEIDPASVSKLEDIPEDIRADYTADGPYYHIRSKAVKDAVLRAAGNEKDLFLLLRRIWDFTRRTLVYKLDARKIAADQTLAAGNGSCSEYSFVIIAMCRAAGLPARYVSGTISPPPKKKWGRDRYFHKVVEVYLPNIGWVPIESTRGTRLAPDTQTEKYFAVDDASLFRFIFEPEPGLVRNDPRKNTISYHSDGPGRMGVKLSVVGEWICETPPTYPSRF